MKAQCVSSGIPLIIRSTKLHLQPLFYIPMWWPAVVQAGWELQVYKPEAADTVWSSWWWAVCRSKHVEPSINFGIINSITKLHLFGYFYWFKDGCWLFLLIQRRLLVICTNSKKVVGYFYWFKEGCWLFLLIQRRLLVVSTDSKKVVGYFYWFKEGCWLFLLIQRGLLVISTDSKKVVGYFYWFEEGYWLFLLIQRRFSVISTDSKKDRFKLIL